jgi:hypothetical protein
MSEGAKMIPRRIVFRVLAACLGSQARALGGNTERRTAARRGALAADDAVSKQPGRREHAEDLLYQADTLARWIGDPAYYQGHEVSAELLGHLSALAFGRSESWAEIRRLSGRPLDGIDWRDMPLVLAALLEHRGADRRQDPD